VPDLLKDVVRQEGSESGGALCRARGAEPSFLARERQQVLEATAPTAQASEAALEDPAVQVAEDGRLDEDAPEAVVLGEGLVPEPLDLLVEGLQQPIEGGGTWAPGP
jgi:hypothetical protein